MGDNLHSKGNNSATSWGYFTHAKLIEPVSAWVLTALSKLNMWDHPTSASKHRAQSPPPSWSKCTKAQELGSGCFMALKSSSSLPSKLLATLTAKPGRTRMLQFDLPDWSFSLIWSFASWQLLLWLGRGIPFLSLEHKKYYLGYFKGPWFQLK